LSGLEPLMSIEELSEYLNVPVRRLYDWRLTSIFRLAEGVVGA
jgi:hypothetical protein